MLRSWEFEKCVSQTHHMRPYTTRIIITFHICAALSIQFNYFFFIFLLMHKIVLTNTKSLKFFLLYIYPTSNHVLFLPFMIQAQSSNWQRIFFVSYLLPNNEEISRKIYWKLNLNLDLNFLFEQLPFDIWVAICSTEWMTTKKNKSQKENKWLSIEICRHSFRFV